MYYLHVLFVCTGLCTSFMYFLYVQVECTSCMCSVYVLVLVIFTSLGTRCMYIVLCISCKHQFYVLLVYTINM